MDRRDFVRSVAAIGGVVPGTLARESQGPVAGGSPDGIADQALAIATFRRETTRQATTFNLSRKSKTLAVGRGARVTIAEGRGPGYIAQFWLTFPGWFWQHWNVTAPVSQSILKTLILRVYWDEAERPAIEAPVGDFFGAGLTEVTSFAARYFGTSSGGFFCKWPMPFRRSFRIEVENLDKTIDTDVFANVLYQQVPSLPDDIGYLHAQFRTGRNPGFRSVPIAEARGRGHYAGCQLYMQGRDRNYLSFLEAPEHVHIDTESEVPTIVGTGLEDYFLGGWYFREGPFIGPYHGLTLKDTFNASVAMYRAHDADAIRFTRRFAFAFVNPWSPDRLKPFCYSSVAYLYLDSPAGQGATLPTPDDLLCWYRVRNTDHQSIP
jgi:hypothetical protein